MDDAGVVGIPDRLDHREEESQALGRRPAAPWLREQVVAKSHTPEPTQHHPRNQVRGPPDVHLRRARVEHVDDVRVPELRERPCFLQELSDPFHPDRLVGRERRLQDLDRDRSVERQVVAGVDDAEAALRDDAVEAVPPLENGPFEGKTAGNLHCHRGVHLD